MNANHHYFVFAAGVLKTYPLKMSFKLCRRFVAVTTAALFLLSAVAHDFVVASMASDTGMTMATAAADMSSSDDATDCATHGDCVAKDTGMRMACFAHCATVIGILSEPVELPVVIAVRRLATATTHPLAGQHRPPDPHPPKSFILI